MRLTSLSKKYSVSMTLSMQAIRFFVMKSLRRGENVGSGTRSFFGFFIPTFSHIKDLLSSFGEPFPGDGDHSLVDLRRDAASAAQLTGNSNGSRAYEGVTDQIPRLG